MYTGLEKQQLLPMMAAVAALASSHQCDVLFSNLHAVHFPSLSLSLSLPPSSLSHLAN